MYADCTLVSVYGGFRLMYNLKAKVIRFWLIERSSR